MKPRALIVALSAVFGFLFSPSAFSADLTLEEILNRMDRAGESLRSMSADIEQRKWTDILQEFDRGQSGKFLFLKERDEVYLRRDIHSPSEDSLVIREGQVTYYQPGIKQAQQYQLGRHRDKAEFLLLGFGSDKEALKEAYDIRLVGREKVDELEVYRLELAPKSGQVAAHFPLIVLWIDTEQWLPIQQQLVEPTQDYLLIRFRGIQLNPRISRSDFDLKLPRDVRIIAN
jgi:outer membrane lipoprotein-sorting protein